MSALYKLPLSAVSDWAPLWWVMNEASDARDMFRSVSELEIKYYEIGVPEIDCMV